MDEEEIINSEKEETTTATAKQKDEEEGSVGAVIFELILAIAAIIALVHWNPSREDHEAVIKENLQEVVQSKVRSTGRMPTFEGLAAVADVAENFEYHDIYICSWTTARLNGKKCVLSIGVLGWTHAMF